jgi:hypothetical protein
VTETRREGSMHYFAFVCPGCGAEGELGIDTRDGYTPFGCPEGCGAMFMPWEHPGTSKWKLTCVVCPVFEDDPAYEQPGAEGAD